MIYSHPFLLTSFPDTRLFSLYSSVRPTCPLSSSFIIMHDPVSDSELPMPTRKVNAPCADRTDQSSDQSQEVCVSSFHPAAFSSTFSLSSPPKPTSEALSILSSKEKASKTSSERIRNPNSNEANSLNRHSVHQIPPSPSTISKGVSTSAAAAAALDTASYSAAIDKFSKLIFLWYLIIPFRLLVNPIQYPFFNLLIPSLSPSHVSIINRGHDLTHPHFPSLT